MTAKAPTLSAFIKMEAAHGYSRKDITIASGQNLPIGAVLGKITASGKFAAYTPGAADGTQNAVAVLIAAADASAADKATVAVVRHAIATKEQLAWGAAVTTQGHKDAAFASLEAAGIVCRSVI